MVILLPFQLEQKLSSVNQSNCCVNVKSTIAVKAPCMRDALTFGSKYSLCVGKNLLDRTIGCRLLYVVTLLGTLRIRILGTLYDRKLLVS